MKNYNEFPKVAIGTSDIATLIMCGMRNGAVVPEMLNFGCDGSYSAYIVRGEAEIGKHYKLIAAFENWMRIYDDFSVIETFRGRTIRVYRAGEMGCIIQILD